MSSRKSGKNVKVAVTPVSVDPKVVRPLLSDPVALIVREYAEECGVTVQAVVNLALFEHFRNKKINNRKN